MPYATRFAAGALGALVLCASANAATISVLAGSNCSIDHSGATYNWVTSNALQIWRFATSDREADMEFDLSVIPAGATVNSVMLRVTTLTTISANTTTPPAFATFNFYSTVGDGISSNTDHTDFDPGAFQASVSYPLGAGGPPANFVLDFPMGNLTDFQNAANGSPNDWVAVHISTPDLVGWRLHALLSGTAGIVKPTLIIDYTPVPAPGAGVVLALCGAGALRRRR